MKTGLFALFENWSGSYDGAIRDQLDLIVYAEKLGFDEVWLTEHHFNNFSVTPSPLSVVSYLLGKSDNIKIGVAGILLPYHNPIKLAEELAVIKSFDNDRFLYGIAKGAFAIYDKAFKGDATSNREVMFEANDLIHKLLTEEQVSFEGKFFSCEDISIRPKVDRIFTTYLASESDEAIKRCATGDYELIGSLATSKDEMLDIFGRIYAINYDKKLEYRVARGINIGLDREAVIEEATKSADIFISSMILSKDTNPTLAKLLTKEYDSIRSRLFDKNSILENAIIGTPKECVEQIRELNGGVNIETLLLKPLVASKKRAKEVLDLYIKEVKPYV